MVAFLLQAIFKTYKAQFQRLVSQKHALVYLSTLGIMLTSLLTIHIKNFSLIKSIYIVCPKLSVFKENVFWRHLLIVTWIDLKFSRHQAIRETHL